MLGLCWSQMKADRITPPQEPKLKNIALRPDVHRSLRQIAAATDEKLVDLADKAIREFIQRNDKLAKAS